MKILVIAHNAFSKTQNNGKTIGSFFSSIPSSDLAQLYFCTNEYPDESLCGNYYRITELDVLKSVFNFSMKTTNSHSRLMQSFSLNDYSVKKDSAWITFFKRHSANIALLRECLWRFNTWDTIELNEWIQSFHPNIIFSVLGNSVYSHVISHKLSKRYNLPLVVFFTDDYVINDISTNFIQRIHYKKICETYKVTMEIADIVYVIGDKMKLDYEKKYKRQIGTLVNSIDFSLFSKIPLIHLDKNKEIIVSFIGGIHLNRWLTIVKLGKIFLDINKLYDLQLRIKVFCVKCPDDKILQIFKQNGIDFCGALDLDGVIQQIIKSHFLLHVESFDQRNKLYTKYSISTKIPEYLASKRRIIAYGPNEVASISLLQDSMYACCLTDLDSDEVIKNKIQIAINSYNNFDYYAQYKYALDKFDKTKMCKRLLSDMEAVLKLPAAKNDTDVHF